MPTRNLGKTGYKVGVFSLGGQAALEKPNNADTAVPIINRALDLGVNYIDTSSIYGGPLRWSEQYVGEAMKTRRNEAFLATKTKERTRRVGRWKRWSRCSSRRWCGIWGSPGIIGRTRWWRRFTGTISTAF
jgi:aryl-alcohol dehydrogenase-like predicted oxidoreductase